MDVKKILVPTDFSEHSQAALAHATVLARDSGATLLILHVDQPHVPYAATEFGGLPGDPNDAGLHNLLRQVKPNDSDVSFTHRLVTGEPAAEIVHVADMERVEMIVIGTHGRRGLSRMLIGSVAEAVVRLAPCPVLTMKLPQHKAAEATR